MKRYCKNVDITSRELIREAVEKCLEPCKKRNRSDTRKLFAEILDVPPSTARKALNLQSDLYFRGVDKIVDMLQKRIVDMDLQLKPVRSEMRKDNSSGKIRKISILAIEQLLLDHVAVFAMRDLSRRIGEFQVSSIKGRGGVMGLRAMRRWVRKKSCKYAAKIDVKDFYGSIDRKILLKWLFRKIGMCPLLRFIGHLISNVDKGIAIGSFLSQTLANIFLSDLYHLAMEGCRDKQGKGKILHALFYMDDMVFLSANKKKLRYAVLEIIDRAKEMGLTIKPNWNVFRISPKRPVDAMGYRFSQYRTTLRKRIFKRARRHILRASRERRREIKTKRKHISLCRAYKLASYKGYIDITNSCRFVNRTNSVFLFHYYFRIIGSHSRNVNYREAKDLAASCFAGHI